MEVKILEVDTLKLSHGLKTTFEGVALVFGSLGAESPGLAAALPPTQDDITKLIVAKIKEDGANNERIKQIVGSYGVSKLSDLPQSKYGEVFTKLGEL